MGYMKQAQIRFSPEDESLIKALIIVRHKENNRSDLIRNLLNEESERQGIWREEIAHILATNVLPTPKRGKDGGPRGKRHIQSSDSLPILKRGKAAHNDAE